MVIFLKFFNSFPSDTSARESWLKALYSHECGSSQSIRSEIFTSDDYIVPKNETIFDLKPGAVPTTFNLVLIEFEEDEILGNYLGRDEFDIEKICEIMSKYRKLQQ